MSAVVAQRPIIIDTDPGLDDAVAILLALACGRFDVLGLTTIAGNIGLDRTSANASGLLAAMGRPDIPVYAGSPMAAGDGIDASDIHGDDGLGGITLPAGRPPETGAVDWLAATLLAQPAGVVDLFALGPLTTIAQLLDEHNEAASRIGHLLIMGGAVDEPGNVGPHSEFNFAADPEAAARVLASSLRITLVPLDVTRRVRASRPFVETLRGTKAGSLSADLLTAYFLGGKESRPLHDPCVVLLALAPQLFRTETLHLAVDLQPGPDRGALRRDQSGHPVAVAMAVDADAVLALLSESLTRLA